MTAPASWLLFAVFGAAFVLRLVLMHARGDFLEFDETFYLLIARSLTAGEGFRMNGLQQIAFPPLPGLFWAGLGLISDNLVMISRIGSCLMGAATVFPAAALARRLFGAAEGILAALLVAVMPSLMTFVPIARPYAESLYFGPEPLYVLLFLLAGATLARALQTRRLGDAATCGALAGLTYLTRNEAISFMAAGTVALALSSRRRALLPLVFAATAAALSIPYVWYLHAVTGTWTFSGKTDSVVLIRESIVSKVRDGDPTAFEALHYSLNEPGTAMRSSYWGFDPGGAGTATGGLLTVSWSSAVENVEVYVTTVLPTLLPWVLWPFALAGALRVLSRLRSTERMGGIGESPMLSLPAIFFPSVSVCLFLFVEPRHHLYLVPVFAVLAAHGMTWSVSAAGARLKPLAWGLIVLVLASLLCLTTWQLVELRGQRAELDYAVALRRMGEELAGRIPNDEPVMSWHPALGYYSNRPWRVMPAASFTRIAAYAARKGVKHLVFETAVHGPPPGSSADLPFTLLEIGRISPERIAAGGYSLRSLAGGPLFQKLVMEEAAGEIPHGAPDEAGGER